MAGLFSGNLAFSAKGLVLAATSSLLFSLFSLIGQKTVSNIDPFQMMATFSFISLAIVNIFFHQNLLLLAGFNVKQFSICFSVGLINNVLGLLSFLIAINYIGASRTSMACTLDPVISIMLAVLILHEPFTIIEFIGALMVISSILLSMPGLNGKVKNILIHKSIKKISSSNA